MTWQSIALTLLLGGVLLPVSLYLHRRKRTSPARVVDIVALAWLFFLVQRAADGPPLLLGALMFLGCFHLGLLMGWSPIRRASD
ncbi:hypothetical protein LDO26_10540 [Luteimonas sp. BDR2-5]|uniref:hypothetical protein n=1 Tax=Proluteimonas luteida TaxID=2878685 RepID=UPI001E576D28|nr:hypothetical protein [Luteimonas sp. BDR2-5]MCD9028642.1 hypothetical protein [Luteimonas sp. BDR2-5]